MKGKSNNLSRHHVYCRALIERQIESKPKYVNWIGKKERKHEREIGRVNMLETTGNVWSHRQHSAFVAVLLNAFLDRAKSNTLNLFTVHTRPVEQLCMQSLCLGVCVFESR